MNENKIIIDHDTNWKEIVGTYFEDFVEFFMPYLYYKIDFAFEYFYRIYDKYKQKIEAIAIFVDNNKSQNPNKFEYEAFHTKLLFEYETIKLI